MRTPALIAILCGACAAAPTRQRFDAPPDTVRSAVDTALAGFPVEAADASSVRTDWLERDSAERPQGVLMDTPDRERVRVTVLLEPEGGATAVALSAIVERRAPGGTRALRWRRISGATVERDLLARIAEALEP